MGKFGERMLLAAFTLKGGMRVDEYIDVAKEVIKEIGMTPHPDGGRIYQYPLEGKGGVGFTLLMPLTESFLAWDVWPELGGSYLIICSCKLFWVRDARKVLEGKGLEVIQTKHEGLAIT